jgi:hypothetical protein
MNGHDLIFDEELNSWRTPTLQELAADVRGELQAEDISLIGVARGGCQVFRRRARQIAEADDDDSSALFSSLDYRVDPTQCRLRSFRAFV